MVLALIQLMLALALSNLLARADFPPSALTALLQVPIILIILKIKMTMKMTITIMMRMMMSCLPSCCFGQSLHNDDDDDDDDDCDDKKEDYGENYDHFSSEARPIPLPWRSSSCRPPAQVSLHLPILSKTE